VGTCTVGDIELGFEDEPPQSYDVHIDCVLDGFIDGEMVDQLAVQTVLDIDSTAPLPMQTEDEIHVRVAAEQWGFAWNHWLIVTSAVGGTFHFEAMSADRLHPQAGVGSPLIDEIGTLLGDDGWSSGIDYASGPGECGQDISCGAVPRVVEAATAEGTQTLEAGAHGEVDLPGDGPFVLVSITAAREYPEDVCDDVPVAWYDIGAIAVVQ
jgi:hypothetical protein